MSTSLSSQAQSLPHNLSDYYMFISSKDLLLTTAVFLVSSLETTHQQEFVQVHEGK